MDIGFFYGLGRKFYDNEENTVNPNTVDGQWGWNFIPALSYDYIGIEIWVQSTDLGNIMRGIYKISFTGEFSNSPNSPSAKNNIIYDNVYNMDYHHLYYHLLGIEEYKHHKIAGVDIPVTGSAISTGATLTGMTWELISKPNNSTAVLEGTTTNSTTIKDVNKHGDHTVKLTASNNNNQTNSDTAVISVSDPRQNTRPPKLMIVDSLRKAKNIMLESRDEAYRTGQFTSPGNHRIEVQHNLVKYKTGNKFENSNVINGSVRPERENVFLVPDVTGILNTPLDIHGNIQNLQWQYSMNGGNWRFIPPLYINNYAGGRGEEFLTQTPSQNTLIPALAYIGGELKDTVRVGKEYSHPASGKVSQSQLEDVWTNGSPLCLSHMFADTTKGNCSVKWRYRYMTWEGAISPWSNEVEVVFIKRNRPTYTQITLAENHDLGDIYWTKQNQKFGKISSNWNNFRYKTVAEVLGSIMISPLIGDPETPLYIGTYNEASKWKVSEVQFKTMEEMSNYGLYWGNGFSVLLYQDESTTELVDKVVVTEENRWSNPFHGGGYGGIS